MSQRFPKPTTRRQKEGLLRLTGYYAQWVPNFSEIARTSYHLTKSHFLEPLSWNGISINGKGFLWSHNIHLQLPKLHVPDYHKTSFLCVYKRKG